MKAEPCKCHPEIPWLCSALALLITKFQQWVRGRNAFFFFPIFTLSIK